MFVHANDSEDMRKLTLAIPSQTIHVEGSIQGLSEESIHSDNT